MTDAPAGQVAAESDESIGDYGLIGDMRTAALVDRWGGGRRQHGRGYFRQDTCSKNRSSVAGKRQKQCHRRREQHQA